MNKKHPLEIKKKGYWHFYIKRYPLGIGLGLATGKVLANLIFNGIKEDLLYYSIEFMVMWIFACLLGLIFSSIEFDKIISKIDEEKGTD